MKKIGILTNQSAYSTHYHFQKIDGLHTLFLPEHGLFAELQDQVSGSSLKYNYGKVKIVNLYGDSESSLYVDEKDLSELDEIIFDIGDVGSRYYTFLTTCFYILQSVHTYHNFSKKRIKIKIHENKNPIGKKIEGTPLENKYSSFVGVETVLHRHGLSIFQLMKYYQHEFDLNVDLAKIDYTNKYKFKENPFLWIPPSPNIPTLETCYAYVGQCLIEGTNLSEGRGTTKPFQIFGSPYINIQDEKLIKELTIYQKENVHLRPLLFMPTFHKYKDQICSGFQMMIKDKNKFDSLLFTIHLLKTLKKFYPENFQFLKGVYEFRSDKSAIELLSGDDIILNYFKDESFKYKSIKDYFNMQESKWKKKIKKFSLLF